MNSTGCSGDCYDYAVLLYENLTLRSRAALVPSYDNGSEPLMIHILFSLIKVISLDNNGLLELFGIMFTGWIDPRLRWNPANYKGISACPVDKANAWTPIFTLLNPAKKPVEYGVSSAGVRVNANGLIVAPIVSDFSTACDMELVNFPFDTQTCTIEFTSFHTAPNLWKPVPVSSEVSLDFYSNSSADPWQVVSTEFITGNKTFQFNKSTLAFPSFTIVLKLVRSPLYYVANLILPSGLLMVLVAFVFVMPPGCEIRVELAATLALALYVLQQVVSTMLPTNDQLPHCQTALNASLILSGIALTTSIVSFSLKSAKIRLPKVVRRFYIHTLSGVCRLGKYRHVLEREGDGETADSLRASKHSLGNAKGGEERESSGGDLAEIRKMLHEYLEMKRRKLLHHEKSNMHKAIWNRLDLTFNLIVLVCYSIAVIYTGSAYLIPNRH